MQIHQQKRARNKLAKFYADEYHLKTILHYTEIATQLKHSFNRKLRSKQKQRGKRRPNTINITQKEVLFLGQTSCTTPHTTSGTTWGTISYAISCTASYATFGAHSIIKESKGGNSRRNRPSQTKSNQARSVGSGQSIRSRNLSLSAASSLNWPRKQEVSITGQVFFTPATFIQ